MFSSVLREMKMRKFVICTAAVVPLCGIGGIVGGTDWRSAKPVVSPLETMNIYEMQTKTDIRTLPGEENYSLF